MWFAVGLVDCWNNKVIQHPPMEANGLPDFLKANNRFGLVWAEDFAGGKIGKVSSPPLMHPNLALHKHLQRPEALPIYSLDPALAILLRVED